MADYGHAIALNPQHAQTFYNRGVARAEQGELEEAIADFGRAIELNARHVAAYHPRALAFVELGKF